MDILNNIMGGFVGILIGSVIVYVSVSIHFPKFLKRLNR